MTLLGPKHEEDTTPAAPCASSEPVTTEEAADLPASTSRLEHLIQKRKDGQAKSNQDIHTKVPRSEATYTNGKWILIRRDGQVAASSFVLYLYRLTGK